MVPETGGAGVWKRFRRLGCLRSMRVGVAVVALSSLLPAQVPGQAAPQATATPTASTRYQEAVQAASNGDLSKFEQIASTPQAGALRTDAMMWLVWSYHRRGDANRAQRWANDLLAAQPGNALALAMLANADQQLTRTSPAEPGADQSLSHAKQALREIDQLHKPEGMSDAAFSEMKSELTRTLNGAIGYAYYQRSDFITARGYLRKAAALAPENAQYAYALSIADLDGRNPETAEGFQMLARAVNLTSGTPAGQELATYARQRYKQVGGTDVVWNQYLANTHVPSTVLLAKAQPPAPASPPAAQPTAPTATASGGTSATIAGANSNGGTASTPTTPPTATPATSAGGASTTPARSGGGTVTVTTTPIEPSAAPTPAVTSPTSASAAPPTATAPTAGSAAPTPNTAAAAANTPAAAPAPSPSSSAPATAATTTTAEVRAPDLPPARTGPPHTPPPLTAPPNPMVARRGTPVSLGILVQSTAASRENRTAVVNNLSDMVRHLRNDDEAFLISFGTNVVFEQDLTNNPQALEEAMDKIQPTAGTALFDAVAFAAGHLKRIAKNGNRLLLVISDGANNTDRISPMELSGDISLSGVQIFCIGIQPPTVEDQQRLRALADRTGGSVVFLNDTGQFRGAAHEIAQRMGIPFE